MDWDWVTRAEEELTGCRFEADSLRERLLGKGRALDSIFGMLGGDCL